MDLDSANVHVVRDMCREIETRFGVTEFSFSSGCDVGHIHDGWSCGLDLSARGSDEPDSFSEFVANAAPIGTGSARPKAWASGSSPQMIVRLSAAYLALVEDPRLPHALDAGDDAELCRHCEEPCTLVRGEHSVQRAALAFRCGSAGRVLALRLMGTWPGTGDALVATVRAATA